MFPSFFFVAPILCTVAYSLQDDSGAFTLGNYQKFLSRTIYSAAILNSLVISLTSTAVIVPVGVVIACAVRKNKKIRSITRSITSLPIVFPSFVFAYALIYIYGTEGSLNILTRDLFGVSLPTAEIIFDRSGIIFANVLFFLPFFIRPLFAVFERLDPAIEQAAISLGSHGLHLLRKIVLPSMAPGIMAGGFLTLLLTMNEFGVILFLGWGKVYTLTLAVYSEIEFVNLNMAATAAALSIVLSLFLATIYRHLSEHLVMWV